MRSLNGTCLVKITTETETTDIVETTVLPWTSTVTTPATTSTTRYIRHLAIHISPTSIQLPELKSNITAIVVPDPELGEEYSYAWVVVSYPQDQQPGTIEGNNEKTLKLSQLSPGNYTFHITVKSPNSLGEAIENLTVLARKLSFCKYFIFFCLPIVDLCSVTCERTPCCCYRSFISNRPFTKQRGHSRR